MRHASGAPSLDFVCPPFPQDLRHFNKVQNEARHEWEDGVFASSRAADLNGIKEQTQSLDLSADPSLNTDIEVKAGSSATQGKDNLIGQEREARL